MDKDYRDNQVRAQKAWGSKNKDYWAQYRVAHPEYVERNRKLQTKRNAQTKARKVAKMDLSPEKTPLSSGIYQLKLLSGPSIAKMDVWIAEITVVTRLRAADQEIAKR